uniref:Ig-like domain-containing protein n=1 Tax=Cyprinus carpio TaxID=7962 RepID=A0A8C1X1G3_CYPCA
MDSVTHITENHIVSDTIFVTVLHYCFQVGYYETESTGIRPNHDGTFQIKKSVEIKEDEKAEYDCFFFHRTLKEPIIIKWGNQSSFFNFVTTLHRLKLTFESSVTNLNRKQKHSLYYIYTALSKPVDLPGVYQFTAMGLLDDTQIDYYNSEEQKKIPKQTWMKEKLYEDYWEKGTQSRKSKEQWFYKNIDILMKRMRHSESDLHVFQMRTGCEVEQWGSEFKFSKFKVTVGRSSRCSSTNQEKMGQYADPKPIHQRIPGERVSLLEIGLFNELILVFLDPPECHMFAKRSIRDKSIVKLSCMVTAFYPKDTALFIRKSRTSLPEDETESTGIRPNHDGTFQIKKSVEIKEDEKAEYGCFVTHRTLSYPIIIKWGN